MIDPQTGHNPGTASHYAVMAIFMLRPGPYTYNQLLAKMSMSVDDYKMMKMKDPEKLFAKILTALVKRGVIYRTAKGQYEKR